MSQEWLEFITGGRGAREGAGSRGLDWNEDGVRAEVRRVSAGPCLAELGWLGVVQVSGEDRDSFLQGQLCNDVRTLSPQRAQLSAHLTQKGRIFANFIALREEDSILLLLPHAQAGALVERLSRYVLRARVRIGDVSEDWLGLGLTADTPSAAVAGLPGPEDAPMATARNGDWRVTRLPGAGLLALTPRVEAARRLWSDAAPDLPRVGNRAWQWALLRAGLAMILPETREQFTPHMIQFEQLGGVSFGKGCYTGQEVVARTEHLGHAKRRLYRLSVETDTTPAPGDALVGAAADAGVNGMIASVQPAPEGDESYDVLGVLPESLAAAGKVFWRDAAGAPMVLRGPALPVA